MTKIALSRTVAMSMVAYLVLAAGCLVFVKWCVGNISDRVQEVRLNHAARSGITSVESDVSSLRNQVESARLTAQEKVSHRLPRVQELKDLAGEYRLRLRRLERVGTAAKGESEGRMHQVVLLGTVADLVNCLKAFEERFVVSGTGVTLQPSDAGGNMVAMTLAVRLED